MDQGLDQSVGGEEEVDLVVEKFGEESRRVVERSLLRERLLSLLLLRVISPSWILKQGYLSTSPTVEQEPNRRREKGLGIHQGCQMTPVCDCTSDGRGAVGTGTEDDPVECMDKGYYNTQYYSYTNQDKSKVSPSKCLMSNEKPG